MIFKIQKILSKYGFNSRRNIEKMIYNKEIFINNQLIKIGDVFEEKDIKIIQIKGVCFNTPLKFLNKMLILNKKIGQICSKKTNENYNTIFDHLPVIKYGKWINIGRLDVNTEGLLLITTDGELAYRLAHPKYNIKRDYKVKVCGLLTTHLFKKLQKGLWYNKKFLIFNNIFFIKGDKFNKWFVVTLYQGRNREVRILWESIGLTVKKLIRISYANIFLPKSLKKGKFTELSKKKINKLRILVNLAKI
ncbi:pseudouridine synthase [Buchnera aphidicola (Mollitrichosiphum nigrofasciatum)]|uniref:pseudouridine synthase n=1 Tax=Buchnera aphidicola TaxID=9 RepID=UPI0031B89919